MLCLLGFIIGHLISWLAVCGLVKLITFVLDSHLVGLLPPAYG